MKKTLSISTIMAYLTNREFLRTIVLFLGGIVLMGAVLATFVLPHYQRMQKLNKELERLTLKAKRYDEFKQFSGNIEQQRQRIAAALRSANVDQLLTDKTDQSVFESLGRICQKANIKLDRINQEKTDAGTQSWAIGLKAPYDRIIGFIALLEHSFKIESFKISSGRTAVVHPAELVVSPLDIPAAAAATAEKDLFDMYDEIEVSLKGVEAPVTTGAGAYTAVRDPMLLLRETRVPAKKEPEKKPALEVVAKPKKPAADLPPLTIENIFWEPETPLVAIDGRVCKEGEKYQEYQVIKIRERNVDILWRNRVYTMQPGSTDIEKEDK